MFLKNTVLAIVETAIEMYRTQSLLRANAAATIALSSFLPEVVDKFLPTCSCEDYKFPVTLYVCVRVWRGGGVAYGTKSSPHAVRHRSST